MIGYKTLKAKSKVIVRNKKVVDRPEITEIVDEQQNVLRHHEPEVSHMELQIVAKRFDPETGDALSDKVMKVNINNIETELNNKKAQKEKIDSEVADYEHLLTDLKKINNKKAGENNG